MLARCLLSSRVCPSVCLSVTSQHCTRAVKRRITQAMRHDSTETTFLVQKISTKFQQDHLQQECQVQVGVGREVSGSDNYRWKFVSIRHGGLRPRRCTGGLIRGVINNIDGSRSWLITVTVQLTSTRLVVWKSLMIHTALQLAVWQLCLLQWCLYT